jgi:hypothetical protein
VNKLGIVCMLTMLVGACCGNSHKDVLDSGEGRPGFSVCILEPVAKVCSDYNSSDGSPPPQVSSDEALGQRLSATSKEMEPTPRLKGGIKRSPLAHAQKAKPLASPPRTRTEVPEGVPAFGTGKAMALPGKGGQAWTRLALPFGGSIETRRPSLILGRNLRS